MTAYISHRNTLCVYMILSLLLIAGCTGGMRNGNQFIPKELAATPKEELMEIIVNDRPFKMEIDGTRLALPLFALKRVYLKPGEHVATWIAMNSGEQVRIPPKPFSGIAGNTYSTKQILPKDFMIRPTSKFIKAQEDVQDRLSSTNTVGLVTDVCIEQDANTKRDYFIIKESKTAAKLMLECATQYLEIEKGYDIQLSVAPFMGAFKDSQINFRLASDVGDKVKEVKSPFYWNQSIMPEPEFRDALVNVVRTVFSSVEKEIERQNYTTPVPLLMEEDVQADCAIIRDKCGSDFLVIIVGNGRKVTKGKAFAASFAEDMATGIVSGLLTGGHVVVIGHGEHGSFLDTYLGVLDLLRGEVIWSNSLRHAVDPTKKEFYYKTWARNLLYHLPEKNKNKRNHLLQPIDKVNNKTNK